MSLKFLCDQCVPNEIGEYLRSDEHEVIPLRQVLPPSSPDSEVIAKAQEVSAVLVTLNGDFSDIVAYPPGKYAGIIAIQLHNHPEIIPQIMKLLLSFLASHSEVNFYRGKLFVVEAHRIRIRQ